MIDEGRRVMPGGDEMARYRKWEEKLKTIMRLTGYADWCKGRPGKKNALRETRKDIGVACIDMDKLVVPPGWRDWEHLGRCVARASQQARSEK